MNDISNFEIQNLKFIANTNSQTTDAVSPLQASKLEWQSVVQPSVASLNSLANVLRQAQPLYAECRLILNYLDHGVDVATTATALPLGNDTRRPEGAPVVEPVIRNRSTIM